jgi:hypothetical protein
MRNTAREYKIIVYEGLTPLIIDDKENNLKQWFSLGIAVYNNKEVTIPY